MGICEDRELDRQLSECLRNGPVQLVSDTPAELQPEMKSPQISADSGSTGPQPNLIRDILCAKVMDKTADMLDRQSAAEVLRLSFNERVEI